MSGMPARPLKIGGASASFWRVDRKLLAPRGASAARPCKARRMEREPKRGDGVERLMIAALVVVTALLAAATVVQIVQALV